VNGKALTLGMKLLDMDAADLLDVLHYFFEEDSARITTGEQAEAISDLRVNLYRGYGINYKYAVKKNSSGQTYGGRAYVSDDNSDLTPFDPTNQETKPFVPATEFDPDSYNPFGSVLDAPLG
jgi:hypothetical protein